MILITGGFGFIGNEVVRQLKNKYGPNKIHVVDDFSRIASDIKDLSDISFSRIDIREFNKVNELIKSLKPETIIHLAALHFIPECNSDPVKTLQINLDSSLNIILSALENQVNHFVFASSGAVYADYEHKINEESYCHPVDIYGYSKMFAEKIIENYLFGSEIKVSICRFFNNYGPRETNAHILPEIFTQLRRNKNYLNLGNIESIRDYVYVEDTAKTVLTILENQENQYDILNIGSGIGFSVRELIEKISELMRIKIDVRLDLNRIRKTDKKVQVADISKIRAYGIKPIDINSGLTRLLEYEGLI
jgi:UDP-glucose 4-epimerase